MEQNREARNGPAQSSQRFHGKRIDFSTNGAEPIDRSHTTNASRHRTYQVTRFLIHYWLKRRMPQPL